MITCHSSPSTENLSLNLHTTFFLCQTYSPTSQASQQESDSQGHLWSSGLHHQNHILFYKWSSLSICFKEHFSFSLFFALTLPSPSVPQRQTVPVAPRTRPAHRDEVGAAIQLVQEHLHSLAPQAYAPATLPQTRDPGICRENGTNNKRIIFLFISIIQVLLKSTSTMFIFFIWSLPYHPSPITVVGTTCPAGRCREQWWRSPEWLWWVTFPFLFLFFLGVLYGLICA